MKNQLLYCITLALGLSPDLFGQMNNLPGNISGHWLNTGINSNGNGVVTDGATDLSWLSSTVSINGPYVKAVKVPASNYWAPAPANNVAWISHPHACPGNTLQSVSFCMGGDHEVYFKISFNVSSPNTFTLNWSAWADNNVYKIYLNNTVTPVYTSPLPYTGSYYWSYGHLGPVSGQISSGWQPETNTLYVHVKSSINPASAPGSLTGFMFTATSNTSGNTTDVAAMDADAEINALQLSPNPATENCELRYNLPGEFKEAFIKIRDLSGRTIDEIKLPEMKNGAIGLNLLKFATGVYLFSLVADNHDLIHKRLVISR